MTTPPPYTVISQGGIQAPVINVRGGKLDLETDLLEKESATLQQWESFVQDQKITIAAAMRDLRERQEDLEVLMQDTKRELAARHTGQTTGYGSWQDTEGRIASARWGMMSPNARGRRDGRWPAAIRTTTTQAGVDAPIAITTRESDGTKSQLSDGPASPDPDLAGSRERAYISPFNISLKFRQTAQTTVQK